MNLEKRISAEKEVKKSLKEYYYKNRK